MKRLARLLVFSFLVSSVNVWASPLPKTKKVSKLYVSHFENVLGTSMEIKIKAGSEKQAAVAETAAMKEIERLSGILSGYDANSEFSKWLKTANEAKHISTELFEVLNLFDQWKERSGGALDASAQVINKLWKEAAAKQTLPTQEEMNAAVARVQTKHWVLDAASQTATHLNNAPLLLNSFAKSYIIKHAADAAMATEDVNAAIVNIGGDIVVAGNLKETVQISDPKADAENDAPLDKLLISNKAIATSGNYRRGELINGKWYSHIIDPRTGLPAGNVISATVVSPNATDAGALATAFNVLSPKESIQLASTIPGTEYMIITKDGERITSKGWEALEIPADKKIKPVAAAAEQWNDYELVVNLELAQLPGFARRPFVAVWVVDQDKNPVRTLSVWFNKDRWLHELRAWYSSCYLKVTADPAGIGSVSSATRSAGKYSLKWDGKDDKGNYVKPGKYTIFIEAAREHGTYQLVNEEMNLGTKPQTTTLTGGAEVASASIDYRKKQ
jgi:thiamine biosynthesis lipoprotein ApbE